MKYQFLEVTRCNMCHSKDLRLLGRRLNQSQGFSPSKKVGISTSVMECRSCGLKFANPIPIPDSIGDHYNLDTEQYFQKTLKEFTPQSFKAELDYFKSIYPAANPRALDIGAGLGRIMKAMERDGIEAYGIEPSKTFLDYAVTGMGIPENHLTNAGIEESEFETNSFDLITFSAVFEHLYDPNRALERALTWLKPGGIIYIGVPSAHSLNQIIANFIYRLRGLDYVSNISPLHPPFHIYEFTEKAFRKNAELNKYTIEKLERITYKTFLPKVLDPVFFPLMKMTKTDMNLAVWLRKG